MSRFFNTVKQTHFLLYDMLDKIYLTNYTKKIIYQPNCWLGQPNMKQQLMATAVRLLRQTL